MRIRQATKKDILPLSEMFHWEIEAQKSLAGYYELREDFDWAAYARERIINRNGCVLVAEHNGALYGFIYCRIINYNPGDGSRSLWKRVRRQSGHKISSPLKPLQWGVIEECYVIPSGRMQGIGSQLVAGSMEWFQKKKSSRVELSVAAGNREGEAFWKKSGFDTFRLSMVKNLDIRNEKKR